MSHITQEMKDQLKQALELEGALPVITEEMAVAALKDAVQLRGEDFVYPVEWTVGYDPDRTDQEITSSMCQYEYEGKPACIVGVAIDLLGLPLPKENDGIFFLAENSAYSDDNGYVVSALAADVWAEAQSLQDKGATWGEAYSHVKNKNLEQGEKK